MALVRFKIKPSEKIYTDGALISNAHWIVVRKELLKSDNKKLKAAFKKVLSLNRGIYDKGSSKPKTRVLPKNYLPVIFQSGSGHYSEAKITSEIYCKLDPYTIEGILLRSDNGSACYIAPEYIDLLSLGDTIKIDGRKGPIIVYRKGQQVARVMPLKYEAPSLASVNKSSLLSALE